MRNFQSKFQARTKKEKEKKREPNQPRHGHALQKLLVDIFQESKLLVNPPGCRLITIRTRLSCSVEKLMDKSRGFIRRACAKIIFPNFSCFKLVLVHASRIETVSVHAFFHHFWHTSLFFHIAQWSIRLIKPAKHFKLSNILKQRRHRFAFLFIPEVVFFQRSMKFANVF